MPERRRPSLVLVHGAWQGSWVWDRLRPELAARGWDTVAVDLPGNGWGARGGEDATFASQSDHLLKLLAALPGPAVLIGHSGGGLSVTQAAEAAPERVAAVVYLAGMMLPSGTPYSALVVEAAQAEGRAFPGVGPRLHWSADRRATRVPADAAREIFLHDADPDTAAWAAERLRPQAEAARAVAPIWTAARFGRLPRLYVEALDDRSLVLPVQRLMQVRVPGAIRASVNCGHVPQLVRPVETAEVLDRALVPMTSAGS
jgi:pimeloyl-ACP methyl ester carboxylesterase